MVIWLARRACMDHFEGVSEMRAKISVGLTLAVGTISTGALGQSVERLETLGGTGSIARDINDAGQIVGESTTVGNAVSRATIWNSGVASDLGGLGPTDNSVAWAINNNGDAVGWNEDSGGLRTSTRFSGGNVLDIGAAMGATGPNVAWDINDAGMIAGQAPLSPGFAKGYIWDEVNGGRVEGTVPGYMGGANLGINNAGILVGHGFFFGDPDIAMLATPDGRGGYDEFEIGPGGSAFQFSIATAISDTNIVVGHANDGAGDWQAVIFQQNPSDPVLPLGRLAGLSVSEANDVNDDGMVVGFGWDGQGIGLDPRAFAWVDGTMFDLNTLLDANSPFDVLLQATGVNNNGDIVGFGRTHDGAIAGFYIEGFVPSPSGLAILGLGGVWASRRRRCVN